jgi:trimethylamine:corrinoid methyltransferase-like protein
MPHLQLLTPELRDRILDEAFTLLMTPGVRVPSAAACALLVEAGARVAGEVVHVPEAVVRVALVSAPSVMRCTRTAYN